MRKRLSAAKPYLPYVMAVTWFGLFVLLSYLWNKLNSMAYETLPNEDQFCSLDPDHFAACLDNFAKGQQVQEQYLADTGKYRIADFNFITKRVTCEGNDTALAECWSAVLEGLQSRLIQKYDQRHIQHIIAYLPLVVISVTVLILSAGYQAEKKIGLASLSSQLFHHLKNRFRKSDPEKTTLINEDNTTTQYPPAPP